VSIAEVEPMIVVEDGPDALVIPIQRPVTVKRQRREPMSRTEMDTRWPSLKHLATTSPTKACEEAWVAAFTISPDSMFSILQDLIKQAYATPGRIGQRPMPKEEDVDLNAMLHGDFCDEPIHVALPKLVKVSLRAFCVKIHMSKTQYLRLLAGDYHPTMEEIRIIASAVKKPASYFVEYRLIAAQAAFVQLITDNPGIATKIYRTYLETKAAKPKARR
jgi:hypothetical protein